ncbi:hypothetical protein ACFQAT_25150 [Undibacterium arcticum]|uniref:Uncharacterized protein n=1 Tax=Undibacterium arcticum TaxID=1762892 RepID=A0ABV7F2P5_9BURK
MTTIDKATLDKLLEGVDPNNPQSMFTDAGLFGRQLRKMKETNRPSLPQHFSHFCVRQVNVASPVADTV